MHLNSPIFYVVGRSYHSSASSQVCVFIHNHLEMLNEKLETIIYVLRLFPSNIIENACVYVCIIVSYLSAVMHACPWVGARVCLGAHVCVCVCVCLSVSECV